MVPTTDKTDWLGEACGWYCHKKIAVQGAMLELAQTRQPAYGVKKQINAELEAKFGLKRSRLSELTKGFDPWALIAKTLSEKPE